MVSGIRAYTPAASNYFTDLSADLSIQDLGTYAEAERHASLVKLMGPRFLLPLAGRLFYSPGGAAVVERANHTGHTNTASGKWRKAWVASPSTAILGLGAMQVKDGVRLADAGKPIMDGKKAFFAWTAGVDADAQTVSVQMDSGDERKLFEEILGLLVKNQSNDSTKQLYIYNNLRTRLSADLKTKLNAAYAPNEETAPPLTDAQLTDILNTLTETTRTVMQEAGETALPDAAKLTKSLRTHWNNRREDIFALKFAKIVASMARQYGFVNLEDVRGKDLPIVFEYLQRQGLQNAIWSDDMQGTGVITAATVLSWADQTGRINTEGAEGTPHAEQAASGAPEVLIQAPPKPLAGQRFIIFGAGAGAMGVYQELINLGVRPEDILVTDTGPNRDYSGTPHPLYEGRKGTESDPFKRIMAQGIPAGTTIESFMEAGVDGIINLGDVKTVTRQNGEPYKALLAKLNQKPIVLNQTNPDPGITPEEVRAERPDAFSGTGNQLYENTANNFAVFGYMGLAALIAHAQGINASMTVAAAWGIHYLAKEAQNYDRHHLVPKATDIRLLPYEAKAIAMAAYDSGSSEFTTQISRGDFEKMVDEEIKQATIEVEHLRKDSWKNAKRTLTQKYGSAYKPLMWTSEMPHYYLAPKVEMAGFNSVATYLGLDSSSYQHLLDAAEATPQFLAHAATDALNALVKPFNTLEKRSKTDVSRHLAEVRKQETDMIINLTSIAPELGMALALKAAQRNATHKELPSIFMDSKVKQAVEITLDRVVPKPRAEDAHRTPKAKHEVARHIAHAQAYMTRRAPARAAVIARA